MEKTTNSFLSNSVLAHFVKVFGLEFHGPDRASGFIRVNDAWNAPYIHIAIADMRSNKRDSYFGMNKYMPSYFVQANYDGIGVKKEDREHIMFDVFEYEDIKNIENEVKSFVKRHIN